MNRQWRGNRGKSKTEGEREGGSTAGSRVVCLSTWQRSTEVSSLKSQTLRLALVNGPISTAQGIISIFFTKNGWYPSECEVISSNARWAHSLSHSSTKHVIGSENKVVVAGRVQVFSSLDITKGYFMWAKQWFSLKPWIFLYRTLETSEKSWWNSSVTLTF